MSPEHGNAKGSGASARAQAVTGAAVLVHESGQDAVYPMFEVKDVTMEGAFLAGSMFLEVGEMVALELGMGDGAQVRLDARIVAIESGDVPGMVVAFMGLDERARDFISSVTRKSQR